MKNPHVSWTKTSSETKLNDLLDYHCWAVYWGTNLQGCGKIHENNKIDFSQKFPTMWY